ncbi:peptide deformylase [Mycoplasmopsis caviae]|uniref:Peptide deformylase n=1 Tax=Mycoplasmopsis caviae TaxID=55603 RepID=A0A3P8K8R9_9BACT|nr:peptide deformylase [Mycoplasmopsis caviae]UUD35444.1 peptide deformylase [Mycoplasmopsis caviae]VDR41779.1 peptide deformylase [Mycoplasmopsis caviae]
MKFKVKLVQLPEKILRKKSKEVKIPLSEEDDKLAQKMIWHIDESQKNDSKMGFRPGVGVAAIQYGIPKQMFYININNESINGRKIDDFRDVLINPKIIATSEYEVSLKGEGCLSVGDNIKNQEGYVYRKKRIVVEAYSYFDKEVKTYDFNNYAAIVAQHELDHLDGKLFIDRINKKEPFKVRKNSEILE